MPLDTFICGNCHITFNDIEDFVVHKRDGCAVGAAEGEEKSEEAVTYTLQMETQDDVADGSEVIGQAEDVTTLVIPAAAGDGTEGIMGLEASEVQTGFNNQTVLIVTTATPKPGKKRGRPKKTKEEKDRDKGKTKPVEKPPLPEKSADDRFHCTACKKAFRRERHYNTHRCLANTDYVDITKKEFLKLEGDEEEEEEELTEMAEVYLDNVEDSDEYVPPDTVTNDDGDLEEKRETTTEIGRPHEPPKVFMSTDADDEENTPEKPTETVEDIPIFNNDNEKEAFEESLNVDLSGLDVMFRVHMIEQELNENATYPPRHPNSNSFFLYSCKTCEKVFKTLSHMRLHCLVHTDLKPFKCAKCKYSCNSKGNLYTHMRKHTGQFYTCQHCSFKTVNKSHLLEHESTHSTEKHPCEICRKSYKTTKSLVNHIRKYHPSKKGKEYLQQCMGNRQTRGLTIIHQCHVCNRKFKKKIDRDRHLFTHDIKDTPNVRKCELCDYSASRRVYLEKHFLKHRIVYQCSKCPERFLSSVRLIDHLTEKHCSNEPSNKWEVLFEECINCSFFLPEPGIEAGNALADKGMVNLPSELAGIDKHQEGEAAVSSLQGEVNESDARVRVERRSEVVATVSVDGEVIHAPNADPIPNPVSNKQTQINGDNDDKPLCINTDDESGEVNSESANPNDDKTTEVDTNTDDKEASVDNESRDFIKRLGYRPMSMRVFHKMRETFGEEECEFCGRLFFTKSDYEPHLRTHTGDKPFGCERCGYRAITKDNLRRHIEREHEKMKFPCQECDFIAHSRTHLWTHQLKHRGVPHVECPVCKAPCDSMKGLLEHGRSVHPEMPEVDWTKSQQAKSYAQTAQGKMGRRSYKCPYCDKVFYRASGELQKHLWIHQGIKPFKCPLCPYGCRSKNNLQAHMLRHSSEKPFVCSECGKAYKSKTALLWHTRAHKGGKLFKCDKCPYEGNQKSHLVRHMETHNITKRYSCNHCDFSSNTVGYMKIHYSRKHTGKVFKPNAQKKTSADLDGAQNQAMSAGTKVYRCLSCDYLFGNLSDMKRHLRERHHVQVDNIYTVETSGATSGAVRETITQGDTTQQTNVQVVEMGEGDRGLTPSEQDAGAALQALQNATTVVQPDENLDDKTASAVNILQQIIGMAQQDVYGQQQITVQSEDGQMMSVDPDTIIVQQGEEVVVSSADPGSEVNQQYLIQYVTPQDMIAQEGVPHDPQHVITQEIIQTQPISYQEGVLPPPTQIVSQPISYHDGVPHEPHQFVSHTQDISMQQGITQNFYQEVTQTETVGNPQGIPQDPHNIILQEIPMEESNIISQQIQGVVSSEDDAVAPSLDPEPVPLEIVTDMEVTTS